MCVLKFTRTLLQIILTSTTQWPPSSHRQCLHQHQVPRSPLTTPTSSSLLECVWDLPLVPPPPPPSYLVTEPASIRYSPSSGTSLQKSPITLKIHYNHPVVLAELKTAKVILTVYSSPLPSSDGGVSGWRWSKQ